MKHKDLVLSALLTIIYCTSFSIYNHNTVVKAGKTVCYIVSIHTILRCPVTYLQ